MRASIIVKQIRKYYLTIAIFLAAAGLLLQYYSSDLGLEYKNVKTIESGQVKSIDILSPNSMTPLVNVGSTFLMGLAISIFISVFIIKKIEEYEQESRKNELEVLNKNINENIFNSLFKTLIPNEIYDIIKSEIIKKELVRKNCVWLYDFRKLDDGAIELKQTLISELHNIGSTIYKKSYSVSFRTCSDLSVSRINRITCEYKNNIITDIQHEKMNFDNDGIQKVDLEIPPGCHADITLVFQTKYNGDEVSDSYFSINPFINATLIATYPKGYKFSTFDFFSNPLREKSADETRSVHEMKGAALPGQGMSFYLTKKCAKKTNGKRIAS